MNKVPRPALAMKVLVPDAAGVKHVWEVAEINHRERTFSVKPFELAGQPWRIDLSWDKDFEPVPNRQNFERAVEQFDSHYRMSDDWQVFDRGQEQEKALIEMFRNLSDSDKIFYRKMVGVITDAHVKS